MRQSLRSSASNTTTSSTGARERAVRVILLNRDTEIVTIESKGKLQEVFNTVCERLSLRETEYFGLAKLVDDEYHFLELDTKLSKLTPKQSRGWRSNRQEERPLLTLYFRVQYYVEHVILLKERITRQLYYQQLKDNLLHHSQLVSEDKCFLLAAYSLQADHGNYTPSKHTSSQYFDAREYFPAWVVKKLSSDYIYENMPVMHRDLRNMPKSEAAKLFIRELSQPPLCHNTHMYKLKKSKEDALGSAWLGICPRGIEIYEDVNGFKSPLSTFLWSNIGKLHFEKKKFEIVPTGGRDGRKFRYYTGSDERSKYLLWLCQGSHIFQLQMAPKLAEQRHMEAEDRKYKESYIHSSYSHHDHGEADPLLAQLAGRTLTPRRSVTSNASSNTTSGIASDRERLHTSIDDSEDTQSQEIMINSPPQCKSGQATPSSSKGVLSMTSYQQPLPQPMSRSGSNQSQNSNRLVARDIVIAKEIPVTREIHVARTPSALKPADTQIMRTTFTQAMTVTSNPVLPNMAPIVSGVATSTNVQYEHAVGAMPMMDYGGVSVNHAMPTSRVVTTQQMVTSQQPLVRPISHEQSSQPVTHNPLYIQPISTPLLTHVPPPPMRAPVSQYPLFLPTTMPDHTYANLPTSVPQTLYSVAPSLGNNMQHMAPTSTTIHQQNMQYNPNLQTLAPSTNQPIQFHQLQATSQPPFFINNQVPFQTTNSNALPLSNGNQAMVVTQPSHHTFSSGSEYSGYNSDYAPYAEFTPHLSEPYIAPPLQFSLQPGQVPDHVMQSREPAGHVHNMVKSPSMEMITTRPNRSRSQTAPPSRAQSAAPQRAVSNAETFSAARRANSSCPMHGLRSGLLKEIEAKNSGKYPMLASLCRDTSLNNRCTCIVDDPAKRFSYSPALDKNEVSNDPGTMTRPMSWHSEHFNLEKSLQIYNGPVSSGVSQASTPLLDTNTASQYMPMHPHHLSAYAGGYNRFMLPHKSMDSLDIGADYPTMVTHQNGHVPAHLYTGLSGAKSLDNLLNNHYYNTMGLAT